MYWEIILSKLVLIVKMRWFMKRYLVSSRGKFFIKMYFIASGAFDLTSLTFPDPFCSLFRLPLEINICRKSLYAPMNFCVCKSFRRQKLKVETFFHFPHSSFSFMQQLASTWLFYCSLTFLSRKLTLIIHRRTKWRGWVSEIELYGRAMCMWLHRDSLNI